MRAPLALCFVYLEASGMDYGEEYDLEHDKLIGHWILATWVTLYAASVTKATRRGQGWWRFSGFALFCHCSGTAQDGARSLWGLVWVMCRARSDESGVGLVMRRLRYV